MGNGLIKRLIGDNCISRFIYSIISLKYIILKKQKNFKLKKNGQNVIEYLQKILEKKNVKFFFDMGTLLGIIREGHLLGHDIDIDIGVFLTNEEEKEDLCKYLESEHCQLKYKFSVKELGVVEYSYLYNEIKFDITFYTNKDKKSICHLLYPDTVETKIMRVVELSCPIINNTDKYNWNDININVPHDPESYLCHRYGDNWKIPDKNYIYWKGPSTKPTNYIGHINRF